MKQHDRRSLRDVKLQLVACGASKGQLRQNEIRELPKALFENETIKAFIMGFYDGGYGMMVASDLRLLFIDVMPFGKVRVDDIPYNMVGTTTLQMGMFFGSITLYARSNIYRFWWLNKNNATDFNEYVELQMLKHQQEEVRVK